MTLLVSPKDFNLPQLSHTVVIFFNLQHLFMFKEIVQGGKIKTYGPSKRFTYEKNGQKVTALGGMIGAPLAVLNIENALYSGAKQFITFGSAGWLSATETAYGNLFSPTAAVDETGMAKDYGSSTTQIPISEAPGTVITCGKIVSINSFYRTTLKRVNEYRENGIDLIDMEAAPLHHIIPLLGGSVQSLFAVSDRFSKGSSWTNGMMTPEFKAGIEEGLNKISTFV